MPSTDNLSRPTEAIIVCYPTSIGARHTTTEQILQRGTIEMGNPVTKDARNAPGLRMKSRSLPISIGSSGTVLIGFRNVTISQPNKERPRMITTSDISKVLRTHTILEERTVPQLNIKREQPITLWKSFSRNKNCFLNLTKDCRRKTKSWQLSHLKRRGRNLLHQEIRVSYADRSRNSGRVLKMQRNSIR